MPLSYSQLATYRRCPKQYEYAYVKKVPRPISLGESFGSSIHNTLKRWGELEMLHAKAATPDQLAMFTEDARQHRAPLELHTLLTLWRGCFIAQGYPTRAEMDANLLRGEQALRHFFEWWSREKREVVGIETSFKWNVKPSQDDAKADGRIRLDTVLSGRLDRVEKHPQGGLRIIDFKSSAPRDQTNVDVDLQLSIYARSAAQLWNEPVTELILLFIGEDECIEMRTARNESQLRDAETAIRHVARRMDEGDYRATPTVEKCRSCPYREVCPARAI